MRHCFTRTDVPVVSDFIKRFDPRHWTVDFPRGTVASLVTGADGHSLTIISEVLRKGDLVGLIFESEDRHAHPAHARETSRDYSRCELSFRWQSTGVAPLDAVNSPTLTIEGRDGSGASRTWFVRLWNYAEGTADDAVIRLNFGDLDGGFLLPAEADPVDARSIDRMFISIIPPDYVANSQEIRTAPALTSLILSEIQCDGSGSVLTLRDAVAPEHPLRIATSYDDHYHLTPGRLVEAAERLGYRGVISHYIGMSHYFALDGAGKLDPTRPLNGPALEWHRAFATAAAERGYELIWSISYEILDMFCPDAWKQRQFDGSPALTGYNPPSTLVSPASSAAITFLSCVAEALVDLSQSAGIQPQVQIGEPWWWVSQGNSICLYDDAARLEFGGTPVEIADVTAAMTVDQRNLLDHAGVLLAGSTATIASAVKSAEPTARTLALIYLPGLLRADAPELRRANLPVGWASPAFDVLQLEDYEWVTAGFAGRSAAFEEVEQRLGYAPPDQHYFAGFVATEADRQQWRAIVKAAEETTRQGVAETFLWALPQVMRDGLTLFGEEDGVTEFEDVLFPIEIGAEASVTPGFSTNVVTAASGYETRNVNWQQARLRYDAGPGIRGDSELETLINFFRARRGAAVGFRFRDPYDFSSNGMSSEPQPADQQIGTGDGTLTQFPLVKAYGSGELRRITRPVAGSVRVSVDGAEQPTGWSLQPGGTISFLAAPAADAVIRAGYLFDVPVRFADDRLEINRASFRAGEAPSVPLVEVREF